MKKHVISKILLVACCIVLSLSMINSAQNQEIVMPEISRLQTSATKEWTIMVYLDGDCNLEEAAINDFNEMEMVGSDSNINIVVQLDRIPDYDETNGDWTTARRYYIEKDTSSTQITSNMEGNLGEVNMGSESTLSSFVSWAQTTYPANKYGLILWDHGSGILAGGRQAGGICWDDTNNYDYLTMAEISSVLSTYSVDLLALDACLMGATEVHYALKDYVDIIVASEELEPGDGYPYNDILAYLKSNPTATPTQLSQQMVLLYDDFYSDAAYSVTQAAVNALTNDFMTSVNDFTTDLLTAVDEQKTTLENARSNVWQFDEDAYVDLYDLADNIKTYCSGEIDTSATALMSAINTIVIEEKHSASQTGANGLSIYFPISLTSYSKSYESTSFALNTQWDEFLRKYYTGSISGEYEDSFEENDDFSSAAVITAGTYYSLILNGADDDFYKIFLDSEVEFEAELYFTHSEGDLDLEFYDSEGTLLTSGESETDNEVIYYTIPVSGYYILHISQYGGSTPYQPYDLKIDDGSDDAYENNDEINDATLITAGQLYSNLVCKDDDFYKIDATEGLLLKVTIEFSYTDGDLDLYLYGPSGGSPVEYSETAADNEVLQYGIRTTGYYYIRVYNYEDNSNYELKAELNDVDDQYEKNNYINQANTIGFGKISNLVCINDDFYKISLIKDQWISILLDFDNEEGDIDLYLYKILEETETEITVDTVGFGITYTDNEFVYYKADQTTDYYILVEPYEINLHYDLTVQKESNIEDDTYEENDYFDDVIPELEVGYSYKELVALDWDFYEIFLRSGYQYSISTKSQEGDIDLFLIEYDSNTEELEILATSAYVGSDESLQYVSSSTGDCYILIYTEQITLNYTLIIIETEAEGFGGIDLSIDAYPIIPFVLISALSISLIICKKRRKNL